MALSLDVKNVEPIRLEGAVPLELEFDKKKQCFDYK